MIEFQHICNTKLPPFEMILASPGDFDFITKNLFHQPTLTENDIADHLSIEPFFEGALYGR